MVKIKKWEKLYFLFWSERRYLSDNIELVNKIKVKLTKDYRSSREQS